MAPVVYAVACQSPPLVPELRSETRLSGQLRCLRVSGCGVTVGFWNPAPVERRRRSARKNVQDRPAGPPPPRTTVRGRGRRFVAKGGCFPTTDRGFQTTDRRFGVPNRRFGVTNRRFASRISHGRFTKGGIPDRSKRLRGRELQRPGGRAMHRQAAIPLATFTFHSAPRANGRGFLRGSGGRGGGGE